MEFEFEEEFQESDVIFSDEYSSDHQSFAGENRRNSRRCKLSNMMNSKKRNRKSESSRSSYCSSTGSCSAPVDIPSGSNNSSPSSSFRYDSGVEFADFGCFDDDDMVPPHVIVDRRSVDGQFASSFERNVTTRRKNLFQVRNSILKLTGFLES